jgi:branched-chain amino acid transport system ATP-binding protein
MLRIRNLESGYGNLSVLRGISIHVSPGEIVTIIGANGAGKTTLLTTIAGLLRRKGGDIIFNGIAYQTIKPETLVAAGCSLVPEGRQVFATLSVHENIALGAYSRFGKEPKRAVLQRTDTMYTLFPRLRERREQLAGTLSGGEQQMLAIARALMAEPKMLMLDEPSMGLAPLIVAEIFKVIRHLKQNGTTILLVEQNAKAALAVADRGYVLETGAIVGEGSSEDLLNNNEVQRAYLGKDYVRINE